MPINTYADIQSFINPVYQGAVMYARDMMLLRALVTPFTDGQGDAPRKLSEYGTATINTVAETDDLASQSFTPSVISTLTPAEAGGQFFITDRRIENDPFGARSDAATELGSAVAQKIETDLTSDFVNFTGGTLGGAGTVITWGYFFALLTALRTTNAPPPYACVMRPEQWHKLGVAVTPAGGAQTNAPQFQDAVMQRFFVQRVSEVDIFTTTNIPKSGTDARIGMFSRQALALDMRRAPRLEPERDASRRGWELNMSTVYAHGVWRPKFGIQALFDATAPTS